MKEGLFQERKRWWRRFLARKPPFWQRIGIKPRNSPLHNFVFFWLFVFIKIDNLVVLIQHFIEIREWLKTCQPLKQLSFTWIRWEFLIPRKFAKPKRFSRTFSPPPTLWTSSHRSWFHMMTIAYVWYRNQELLSLIVPSSVDPSDVGPLPS